MVLMPPMPPDPTMMAMPPADPMLGGGMPAPGPMLPMVDPMMGGMMPPPGMPGFPPGVMPDMNYPGSPAVVNAELMLAMQDPEVAASLIRALIAELDPDPGPKYPVWFRKEDYPRPNAQDVLTKADEDRQGYQLLIDRMRRDRDRIQMAVVGSFDSRDELEEAGATTFQDASLAIDIQMIVSILSACDLLFHKTARRADEREEAQQIENFCYALLDQVSRYHHRMNGTDAKTDLVKVALQTGHLVARVLPNYQVDDDEIPVVVDLLDPATCFPDRDQHGIETMTRVYHQPVKAIVRGFGLDRKRTQRILGKQHKDMNGTLRDRRMGDSVEVVEFWNRRWYALFVDREVVIPPTDHLLGFVPFVYTRSAVGDPGIVYEANLSSAYGMIDRAMQRDFANKGQSHIQYLQKTHEQREAILGVVATEVKKIRNPPRTFEQAITAINDGAPQVSNAEGMVNVLKLGEEREVPVQPDARFSLMGPLMAASSEAAQMGRMSPSDYGLAPGSQSSGTVVEGLSEASKDKLNLWKIMIQQHVGGIMELALAICRDHGRKLGPDGRRGDPLAIEKQHPTEREDGYFDFDHRILRRHTCNIRVEMTHLRMQNLGPMGNSVQMWKNMGMMTNEDALTLRGVRDPEAYMRKVQIEGFKQTPEYLTAQLIKWMKQEGEDPETIGTVMYLLATKGGGGGQPPGGGGAPGPMPGNGGAPPTVGMPGAPGQEGGAPIQLPGPPPAMGGIG